jgi:hypothetical protein
MLQKLCGRVLFSCVMVLTWPASALANDIVLYTSDASVVKGNWATASSSTAADGRLLRSANLGWATPDQPLAAPANYFEMTFDAPAGTAYRVWLRLRAAGNSKWNDAVWVQFSDAVASGKAIHRIGTNSGLMVNLERCSGCGTSGWGWQNTAYWLSQTTTVSFASSGTHTVRVQIREDGVEVDQIVLSPAKYLSAAPGPIINDSTIVPKSTTSPPPANGSTPYSGTPAPIPGTIEAVRFDNGGTNVAYADSDAGNNGGALRATDVDIEPSSGGGYNIGWIAPNEWLKYTVNVASSGSYTAQFRLASIGGGSFQVSFGSPTNASTTVSVPNTGAWQTWTTVNVPVTLAAGQQVMTVRFTTAAINFKSVAFGGGASTPPGGGQTILVKAGMSLQAAIDAARPGDTILLQAGATFVGNFVLPAKSESSTAYITIRSAASDGVLPGSSTRITPAYAGQLPKLRSPNSAPALATAPGAHHYRLQFLEFLANYKGQGDIIQLGDGSSKQNSLGVVPHHLIVDRVFIHGDDSYGQKRGIALNSAATSILNSYISDIKLAGIDTQAIAGWNGPGPYEIVNNYLEAAGENVMFGGADPKIPNLVPSDITLRGNHLSKPLAWRTKGWQVKNLLELKNAQRVTIDANVFEHNWQAAQVGYSILLTPVNQDGTAPWSVVQDIEFSNNIVRDVAAGISIGRGSSDVKDVNNVTIRNNLFDRISRATYGGSGYFLLIVGGSDVVVDHNTIVSDGGSVVVPDYRPTYRFVFTNNILIDHAYAIKGAGEAAGTDTIDRYFPDGDFAGGIYIGSNPKYYPTGNYYPATIADVGFVNFSGGDYRLSSNSIYRNGGTDGRDPGFSPR